MFSFKLSPIKEMLAILTGSKENNDLTDLNIFVAINTLDVNIALNTIVNINLFLQSSADPQKGNFCPVSEFSPKNVKILFF